MFRLIAAAAMVVLVSSVHAQEVVLKVHHPVPTSATGHKKVVQPGFPSLLA